MGCWNGLAALCKAARGSDASVYGGVATLQRLMQVAMTLLKSCGKKLLALDDMEEIVAYLKAEVSVPKCRRTQLQLISFHEPNC